MGSTVDNRYGVVEQTVGDIHLIGIGVKSNGMRCRANSYRGSIIRRFVDDRNVTIKSVNDVHLVGCFD